MNRLSVLLLLALLSMLLPRRGAAESGYTSLKELLSSQRSSASATDDDAAEDEADSSEEAEEDAEDAEEEDSDAADEAPAEDPDDAAAEIASPSVAPYLLLNLQGQRFRSRGTDGAVGNFSDLTLYWGEAGADAVSGPWAAHFSVLLNDAGPALTINEEYLRYQPAGSAFFARAGRLVLPFGNNAYYFPTYPAANDLGFTTVRAAGGGWQGASSSVEVYAFDPLNHAAGSGPEYSGVWDISTQAATEGAPGWRVAAGCTSNLGAHDLRLGGDRLSRRTPAANVFAQYDQPLRRGQLHLLADYTCALEGFAAQQLDADEDGSGDRPSALNTELVWEPRAGWLYGVNYQTTGEMAGYADSLWGVMFGCPLGEHAALKLSYTRGRFGAFAPELSRDSQFVADLGISL